MSEPASVPAGHPSDEIARLDAGELAAAFHRLSLSPVEVAATLLDRIDAIDPRINAIAHVDRAATLAQA